LNDFSYLNILKLCRYFPWNKSLAACCFWFLWFFDFFFAHSLPDDGEEGYF